MEAFNLQSFRKRSKLLRMMKITKFLIDILTLALIYVQEMLSLREFYSSVKIFGMISLVLLVLIRLIYS